MVDTVDAVESVARAFYALQDNARGWEREPEALREPFREYARAAIALLHETKHEERVSPVDRV
jgi:hypothetical protein